MDLDQSNTFTYDTFTYTHIQFELIRYTCPDVLEEPNIKSSLSTQSLGFPNNSDQSSLNAMVSNFKRRQTYYGPAADAAAYFNQPAIGWALPQGKNPADFVMEASEVRGEEGGEGEIGSH